MIVKIEPGMPDLYHTKQAGFLTLEQMWEQGLSGGQRPGMPPPPSTPSYRGGGGQETPLLDTGLPPVRADEPMPAHARMAHLAQREQAKQHRQRARMSADHQLSHGKSWIC